MGFKEMIIGIILVGIFSISMITFGFQTAFDNNSTSNILNDPSIDSFNSSLGSNLQKIQEQTQSQRQAFEQGEVQSSQEQDLLQITTRAFSAVKSFFSVGLGTFNLIVTAISSVIGIPHLIINIFLSMVMITILLLIWRVVKVGGT